MNETNFFVSSTTSDLRLAASIHAMGIRPIGDGITPLKSGGGLVTTWSFGQYSDCGRWRLSDLLAWWRDPEFHRKDPSHPFSAVKLTMKSASECLRAVKNGLGIQCNHSPDGFFMLSAGNSGMHSAPPPSLAGSYCSASVSEWAILSYAGFESWETPGGANRRTRIFSMAPKYRHSFEEAFASIHHDSFIDENPQHPLAYAAAAQSWYRKISVEINSNKPHVMIKKGESIAFLHPDCSAETERKILSRF